MLTTAVLTRTMLTIATCTTARLGGLASELERRPLTHVQGAHALGGQRPLLLLLLHLDAALLLGRLGRRGSALDALGALALEPLLLALDVVLPLDADDRDLRVLLVLGLGLGLELGVRVRG